MSYTFIKCKHHKLNNLDYGYILVINSLQILNKWIEDTMDKSTIDAYLNFAENVVVNNGHAHGHCSNATAVMSLFMAELNGTSFIDELSNLQTKKIMGMIKCINKYGEIMIQQNGSYTVNLKKVSDPIYSDKLIYPVEKYTESDINIVQWPGGNHYYGKVGPYEIPDLKRNTYDMALHACKLLLTDLNNGKI